MHDDQSLHAAIVRATEEMEGISVLVLFGSRAGGRARPDSDLDVAILPAEGFEERRRLQARIAVALADIAPRGRVDVVILDEVPELLRQRVMEEGRVLILRDPDRWRELRRRTMWEHGDREPYRRLLRRAQRRRLTSEGGAHG